jgi:hypothetical protein
MAGRSPERTRVRDDHTWEVLDLRLPDLFTDTDSPVRQPSGAGVSIVKAVLLRHFNRLERDAVAVGLGWSLWIVRWRRWPGTKPLQGARLARVRWNRCRAEARRSMFDVDHWRHLAHAAMAAGTSPGPCTAALEWMIAGRSSRRE